VSQGKKGKVLNLGIGEEEKGQAKKKPWEDEGNGFLGQGAKNKNGNRAKFVYSHWKVGGGRNQWKGKAK